MMFLDFENRPLIIPESERHLQNFFFAAISMVLGNSLAISFLFSRPQNVFSRRNNKRSRILNDQAFLGFNFIHWFTKIWFLFCVFAWQTMGSEFTKTFLLPSVLLITVLYLDSWKTLIQVIKKNRWKIQFIHLIVFLLLSFLLSRINIVDYKSFDEAILAANPTVDVPSSSYKYDNIHRRYYDNLVFKMDFNSKGKLELLNSENEEIEFHEVFKTIEEWKENFYMPEYSRFSIRLRANKNISIKHIKYFELQLIEYNNLSMIYEVVNEDISTSSLYNNQIKYRVSSSLQEELEVVGSLPRVAGWDWYKELRYQDTIPINISKNIFVNRTEFSSDELSLEFKKYISQSTIFEYIYGDEVTYQDYINVLSAHKQAVLKLRMTEDFHNIDKQYYYNQFNRDEELNQERKHIIDKYPFQITEKFE
ncbi:MAG: hypothetical protein EVB11_11780 [Winogradskyella sp.]|nr:MAG: hypothetical protein EVB11_11780 [Winogradskyella sp.]